MKGLSEIVVIVLLVMITVSVAGLAYVFEVANYDAAASGSSSYVATVAQSPVKSFKVESIDINKIYIRNTGGDDLTDIRVYLNGNPAKYNVTPSVIGDGQVGTITIYDFLKEDDMITLSSPSGYTSTKRVEDPCDKAVGCWKFDEGTGSVGHDSSPSNITLTLNGGLDLTGWRNGSECISGSCLQFDGNSDYASNSNASKLPLGSSPRTMEAWIKPTGYPDGTYNGFIGYGAMACTSLGSLFSIRNNGMLSMAFWCNDALQTTGTAVQTGIWAHAVLIYEGGTTVRFYLNGNLVQPPISISAGIPANTQNGPVRIGCTDYPGRYFQGLIDEVRIYNRAIY